MLTLSPPHPPVPPFRPQLNLVKFGAKEVASTAVALARLEHYDPELTSELSNMYLLKQASFRGQEMANLAWALSKLRHKDKCVMVAIAEQVRVWQWPRREQQCVDVWTKCGAGGCGNG